MSNQSLQLQLFVMGDNRCGQAGTGGDELLTKPTKISGIDEHDVFRIISNGNQSFAILFNATVFSAGENDNSELCRPGKRSVFQRIDMLETFKIVDVAMGEGFFHLLAQNGQLLSYGKNDMGQLGTGNRDSKDKPRINANIKEPLLQIASGLHHTVALTKSGQVSTWGGNRKGQLGDGQLTSSINPIPLIQLRHRPVISITCGEYHTAVLTSGGNVFTWGANDHGQLGHGDTTARLRPELVRSLRSNKVINIACGRSHSLFLAANYLLFATGSNTHGQCGQELGFRQVVSPTVVEYFREKRTIDIACGALHSFVIATSLSNTLKRKLYVMGSNACGQLGLESLTNTDYPTISSINANLIEAIFAYPLSLTSFLLTFENLCSVDDENIDQNVVINPKIRMRPFPSVSYEEISSLLNRLPADPSTVAANRQAFVDQHIREVREAISAAFSSISVLNASFLSDHSTSSGYNQFVCVDLYSVRRAYESIMRVESTYPSIVVTLGRTLVHICDELKQCPFDDSENLSVFFILLENPLLLRTAKYHIVLEKLVSSILSLPKALRLELFKRMKSYPSEYFGRIVTVMMQFLHLILTDKTLGLDSTPVILVLETLHASSVEMENILPNRAFYHETLPKEINLLQEWQRFQDSRAQQLSSVVNYWQYPFLIDEQHKFQVLQYEYQRRRVMTVHSLLARYDVTNVIRHLQLQHQEQLQQSQSATHTESLDDSSDGDSELGRSNGDPAEIQRVSLSGEQLSVQLQSYLPVGMKVHLSERLTAASFTSSHALPVFTVTAAFHVQVRRSTLLADIRHLLSSVLQSDPNVLFLPIKVQFEEELGEDLGGLTKELFTLLVRQLMQDSGAFALSSSGQTYWFSHHNSAIPKQVENNNNLISWEYMLGLIQSLAMYHGIQIDIPLPRSIFKTLTGKELLLSDLWAADRELAQGLKQLLQYPEGEASIEDTFGVSFVASVNPLLDLYSNEAISVSPLVVNGEAKTVTRGNRQEFVQAFINHALYKSCQCVIDDYMNGVKRLLGQDVWQICSFEELEVITVGMSLNESLLAMRPAAIYAGPHFNDKHPIIEWFWEIVGEFSLLQKKQFLLFVSGSERAPIGGLSQLHLTIQSTEQEGNSLPSSRTCFNLLFLSRHYLNKSILREKLLMAIEHSQGFGLI